MLLVSTRRKETKRFVVVVMPSEVSTIMPVGIRGQVNSLRSLHIIPIAELSTTNAIPSVSQEKSLSPELALTEKDKICNLGKGLCRFQRRQPLLTKIFEKLCAPMSLKQRLIRSCRIGYKYTNSIIEKYSTDLIKPSGGSGKW